MATGLAWKVYNAKGEMIATTRWPEEAACLCGMNGDGCTVKWNGAKIVWREGKEAFSGGTSYDGAAATMVDRVRAYNQANHEKWVKADAERAASILHAAKGGS